MAYPCCVLFGAVFKNMHVHFIFFKIEIRFQNESPKCGVGLTEFDLVGDFVMKSLKSPMLRHCQTPI